MPAVAYAGGRLCRQAPAGREHGVDRELIAEKDRVGGVTGRKQAEVMAAPDSPRGGFGQRRDRLFDRDARLPNRPAQGCVQSERRAGDGPLQPGPVAGEAGHAAGDGQ